MHDDHDEGEDGFDDLEELPLVAQAELYEEAADDIDRRLERLRLSLHGSPVTEWDDEDLTMCLGAGAALQLLLRSVAAQRREHGGPQLRVEEGGTP